MFTDEELKFIETILKDELFRLSMKRCQIEDYERVKEFDKILKTRKDFIKSLLEKITK